MKPATAPTGDFHFRLIGGGLQLRLNKSGDLANVLMLDEALWAMTAADFEALRFDRRFLEFIDCDHDGQIRSDEVKKSVKFVLDYFRDLDGVVEGREELFLDSINPDAPGAAEAISCGKLLLKNLNRSADAGVTVQDIRDARSITSFTQRNGDGVISCENGLSPEVARLITAIIASGRKSSDRSGSDGVSLENTESFQTALTRRLELLTKVENDPSIMVYGEETAGIYELFKECEPLINSYFLNSDAGAFLAADPSRPVKKEMSADLMVSENVRSVLETAAVAMPGDNGVLDFDSPLNPLYADKLLRLAESCALKDFIRDRKLSKADFQKAQAAFVPYASWHSEMMIIDGLENFQTAELKELAQAPFAELKELIASDLSFAPVIGAGETLLKMAYFQQYMMEFLNNFVSLYDLFNPDRVSRLQMGKLVMDGRHFTLTVRVKNLAEHKRIIKSSNICVIYVEIMRAAADNKPVKELLAVAVTGGMMRSLFVGKHGVFFDSEGMIYDAVIKDMVEQPVSIGEAFKAPFFQFADFLSKQTEKIFNSRNMEMQKNLSTEMNKAAPPPATAAPAAKTPAPAAQNPGSGNSVAMLIMGGGIGLAALGSSIAFIAKSLQNVSIGTIFAVLTGIVIIFGGPSVINALVKIFRRNLSRFLESCGCAVNRPMRMSRKMGNIFTFAPHRPKGEIILTDLVDEFSPSGCSKKIWRRIVLITLLVLLLAAGGWFAAKRLIRRAPAEKQKTECKAEVKKAECKAAKENKKVEGKEAAKPHINKETPASGKKKPETDKKNQGDKKNAGPVA